MNGAQIAISRRTPGHPELHAVTIIVAEDEAHEILSVLRNSPQSCRASLAVEEILSSVADGEREGRTR